VAKAVLTINALTVLTHHTIGGCSFDFILSKTLQRKTTKANKTSSELFMKQTATAAYR
jgi:hypothetical protein